MHQLKNTRIWRRTLIVAIPGPKNPLGTQRTVNLLRVPFKILERLIYARFEPTIYPFVILEQAGFRHERLTIVQVTVLTHDIGDSFSPKAGAVFVDVSAAYNTVFHCGLTCELLRMLQYLTDTWSA